MATTCITCQAKTDFFNGGMCLATPVSIATATGTSTTALTALTEELGLYPDHGPDCG